MIPTLQVTRVTLPRATRNTLLRLSRQRVRFQSTSSSSFASPSGSGNNFAVGLFGGVVGAGLLYTILSFTPAGQAASKVNKAVAGADKQYQAAAKKLQSSSPDADSAIESIKQFAYTYVAWIPGGRGYVDTAFKDLETVREHHKEDADKIVLDAYKQFQELSKAGLSLETMSSAYDVLTDVAHKIADLSGEAIFDVLHNHPQVKEQLGGSIDQLKDMGSKYGPDAKKQVDETWSQLKPILAGGLTASNIQRARQVLEDKTEQLQKLGNEAWNKSIKEMKPYLDNAPEIKNLVEENMDKLRLGNAKELFDKVRQAADSGKVEDLKKYIESAADKANKRGEEGGKGQGPGGGWVDLLPQGGSEVISKLRELAQVADKHKDEGRQLLKETVDELKKVLEDKSQRAQEILEQAGDNAKKDVKKGSK